jgi:hypothetical protein
LLRDRTSRATLIFFALALYLMIFSQASSAEEVAKFESDAEVQPENKLAITEKITVVFDKPAKTFVRRYALDMGDAQNPEKFVLQKVTNEKGRTLNFDINQPEDEKTKAQNLDVKVESDEELTGMQTYVLEYTIQPALRIVNGEQQLKLEVTGQDWTMPVKDITCKVHFAGDLNAKTKGAVLVTADPATPGQALETTGKGNNLAFNVQKIMPGEGIIVNATFPLAESAPVEKAQEAWKQFLPTLPLALFETLLVPILALLWLAQTKKQGKANPNLFKSSPTQWSPPNTLTPAELGALLDITCPSRVIFGTLLDLAARGHLLIVSWPDANAPTKQESTISHRLDYRFIKSTPTKKNDVIQSYEKELLIAIFRTGVENRYSEMKEDFPKSISLIRGNILETLANRGLIRCMPEKLTQIYTQKAQQLLILGLIGTLVAGAVAASALWFGGTASLLYLVTFVVGIPIAGLILLSQVNSIPLVTASGAEEASRYLGMKTFLVAQSKGAVAKLVKSKPDIFDRVFGHAFVMNDTDALGAAFQGYLEQRTWFELNPKDPNMSLREWSRQVTKSMNLVNKALGD